MGPLAQSIPLQTLGPQQAEVHGSFYRGGGRSYPRDLPGAKSPRIKGFLKGRGRAWRVLWETPGPHTTVGGAHSYNSLCSELLSLPLNLTSQVPLPPILSQLNLPWAQSHSVQKDPCWAGRWRTCHSHTHILVPHMAN